MYSAPTTSAVSMRLEAGDEVVEELSDEEVGPEAEVDTVLAKEVDVSEEAAASDKREGKVEEVESAAVEEMERVKEESAGRRIWADFIFNYEKRKTTYQNEIYVRFYSHNSRTKA